MKEALRKRMRALRAGWTEAWARERSRKVCRRLAAWPVFRAARVIAAYRATPGEVRLEPLLRAAAGRGVRICVPFYEAKRGAYAWAWWTPAAPERAGRHGIAEPKRPRRADPAEVDLVLVPGLAFDAAGHRLGRGGGHFDRLLARTAGWRAGVAFEAQRVTRVPVGSHDVNVDVVITDKEMYAIKVKPNLKKSEEPGARSPGPAGAEHE